MSDARTSAFTDTGQIQVIDWHMLDKRKFYPLSLSCSFTIRALLYPINVVKTRLQIQQGNSVYNGTFDAFVKIFKSEGITGLYRGYWINSFQIISGIFYVTTYEGVRHFLANHSSIQDGHIRAFIGGGCASLVGQTIIVPFDVVSQHMMMLGNVYKKHPKASSVFRNSDSLNILPKVRSQSSVRSKLLGVTVAQEILHRDGIRGFYRGYVASVICYVPNGMLFWSLYTSYADTTPHLALQVCAAPLSGMSATFLTNPLDLLRARIQIQRLPYRHTMHILWVEERWRIFVKGLTARLIASSFFSTFIIFGYETMKRLSVRSDYKEHIRW